MTVVPVVVGKSSSIVAKSDIALLLKTIVSGPKSGFTNKGEESCQFRLNKNISEKSLQMGNGMKCSALWVDGTA